MDNERKLFEELLKSDGIDPAGPTEAEAKAFAKMLDEQSKRKGQKPGIARPEIWRKIMLSRISKFAAAAVIIAVCCLSIVFLDKTVTTAYAFEQTLEAMQDVRTVHAWCRDWNDAKFEIWTELNPETEMPEYCRAYWPGSKFLAISRPDRSYQYQERVNRVQVNSGSLLNIGVAPTRIFQDLVAFSQMENPPVEVTMYFERDSQSGKTLIVTVSEGQDESYKIYIDPETKLPLRIQNNGSKKRLGAFIKDVDRIEFDVDLPKDIFDFEIPEGATVFDHDQGNRLLNNPTYGMSSEGLSEQEAAERIAIQYWDALISNDKEATKKLSPVCPEMVDSSLIDELVEVGKLYIEAGCGIGKLIPCRIRYKDGSLKEWKLIIMNTEKINGYPSCVIAGYYDSPTDIE